MNAVFGLSGLISLGIAFVLMYVVLRKYTYPAVEQPFFSDPRLFMLLAIGLVEGSILCAVFWFFNSYSRTGWIYPILAIFAVICELAKHVTLNLKRFAGKSDTIFYGFGLGIGTGAAMGTGTLMSFFVLGDQWMDAPSAVLMITISVILIFVNAATGLIVGEGVARYRALEFTLKAMMISVAVYLVLALALNIPNDDTWFLMIVIPIADLILIGYFLYRGAFVSLPKIVDDVIRQEKRNQESLNSRKE